MVEMNRHAFACGSLLADWIRDQPSAGLEDTGHSLSRMYLNMFATFG